MANSAHTTFEDDSSGGHTRKKSWLSRALAKVLGHQNGDATLKESIEGVIEEHTASSETLTDQQSRMLMNILHFGDLRVEDVMVPRADIVAVEDTDSFEELIQQFHVAGHSRLPVYHETPDDPIGMYHIKDLLGLVVGNPAAHEATQSEVNKLRRPVLFAPPSMPVIDLFQKMQATRVHMALVIDEYGGTDGLVTIEDLVEEVFGEIEDEHDTAETDLIRKVREGVFLADARCEVEDVEELLEVSFGLDEDEDVDTLGGLIFSIIDRVPQRGELIDHPAGLEFEIIDVDPRRIKKVRLRMKKPVSKTADPSGKKAGQQTAAK